MTVEERMTWQREQGELIRKRTFSAQVKPDPIFEKPRKPTMQERLAAFVEDRTYDDIPEKRPDGTPVEPIKPNSVRSMRDVHDILAKEMPEEFIRMRPSEMKRPAKSFGSIGMEDLEIVEPKRKQYSDDSIIESVFSSMQEPAQANKTQDSTYVRHVIAEIPVENRPPVHMNPTPIRPFAPPKPAQHADSAETAELPAATVKNMQNTMLAAIRANRAKTMDNIDNF